MRMICALAPAVVGGSRTSSTTWTLVSTTTSPSASLVAVVASGRAGGGRPSSLTLEGASSISLSPMSTESTSSYEEVREPAPVLVETDVSDFGAGGGAELAGPGATELVASFFTPSSFGA